VILGSAQPLTEMSTRVFFCLRGGGGGGRPVRRAENLSTLICRLSINSGSLNLLEPSGPFQACTRIALPFTFMYMYVCKRFSSLAETQLQIKIAKFKHVGPVCYTPV